MGKNNKNHGFGVVFLLICVVFALFSPFSFSKPVFAYGEKNNLTSAKSMIVLERTTLRPLYYHNENQRLLLSDR